MIGVGTAVIVPVTYMLSCCVGTLTFSMRARVLPVQAFRTRL